MAERSNQGETATADLAAAPQTDGAVQISAWRGLNEAPDRPWLIWQLTGRGFGSELLIMVMAMLHATVTGRSFRLASRGSNLAVNQGWTDWFEPFCPGYDSLVMRRDWIRKSTSPFARWLSRAAQAGWMGPRNSVLAHEVFRDVWNENQNTRHFRIPELGIDGDLAHACSVCLKMIWRFQPQVHTEISGLLAALNLEAESYAALHVRRGDKYKEAALTELAIYVERLERQRPDLKTIFVATDDYATIAELRRLRPALNWKTLAGATRVGHLQRRFNRRPAAFRRQDILELLAELEVLRGCAFFVGTASSNIGRLVGIFKGLEKCAFVDGAFMIVR